MNEETKEKKEVKFLSSLAMAVADVDGAVKHLQFTIVQELESKQIRCFFDVVDPSKVKLAPESDEV